MKVIIVILCFMAIGCGDMVLSSNAIAEPSTIYIHYVYYDCRDSLNLSQEWQYIVDCDKYLGRQMVYGERTRQGVPSTEGCRHTWKLEWVTNDVDFLMRQIRKWFGRENIQVTVSRENI